MSSSDIQARLGAALVDFAENGTFPDEDAAAAADLETSGLPIALQALNDAKASLEVSSNFWFLGPSHSICLILMHILFKHDIRRISGEEAPNVDTWIEHAKALQDDIEKSQRVANEIVREAEAVDEREEALKQQERYVSFLEREEAYYSQLHDAFQLMQEVHESLEKADELVSERYILEPVQILES